MKPTVRKEVLQQVELIMAQYCEGCFLHRHLKQEGGRRLAHRFCISQCTVGETLKEYGKKLI
ncbi:zinc-finger domain-containing protein [Neobacillus sp. OS1-32]|uniref:zinc-finger domain-containing protein n=1 Tax=Neobacillus sp. OS1-32 TaxID=3070682 RepID=UPI0027E1BBC9|nr:zinc-finger domain-containing protein [Neobacillus sp. OS1-32]WML30931.1 zinc-finger domain-containing protein [Neobacillus sp. OS1-32]